MFADVEWAEPGIEEYDFGQIEPEDYVADNAYIMYNQSRPTEKDKAMIPAAVLPNLQPSNLPIRFHVNNDVWYEIRSHREPREYFTLHFMVYDYELPMNTPFWNSANGLPRINALINAMNHLASVLSFYPILIHNNREPMGAVQFYITEDWASFYNRTTADPLINLQIEWHPSIEYHVQLAGVVADTLCAMREEITRAQFDPAWIPF